MQYTIFCNTILSHMAANIPQLVLVNIKQILVTINSLIIATAKYNINSNIYTLSGKSLDRNFKCQKITEQIQIFKLLSKS